MDFTELVNNINSYGEMPASFWGCALAGEVGELCNLIKKGERGQLIFDRDLKEEIADVFIYLVLVAKHYHIDIESAITHKMIATTRRRGG